MKDKCIKSMPNRVYKQYCSLCGNTLDVPAWGAYYCCVNVITTRTINAYRECYPEADEALKAWTALMRKGSFKHFVELRRVFGSADSIADDVVVFNIKGNHFRLVAGVDYTRQAVYVKWFGRHKDYDKINPLEVKHEYPPC